MYMWKIYIYMIVILLFIFIELPIYNKWIIYYDSFDNFNLNCKYYHYQNLFKIICINLRIITIKLIEIFKLKILSIFIIIFILLYEKSAKFYQVDCQNA